jgi:hypothetical protein
LINVKRYHLNKINQTRNISEIISYIFTYFNK